MPIFDKPQFNSVWASGGVKTPPDSAKVNQGWVVEIPPYEYDNWIRNRQDAMLAHINQAGVVARDSTVEYQANKSYVQGSTGTIYKCLVTHTNINPESDVNGNWEVAFQRNGEALLKSQNLADVPDKALARVNLGIATTADYDNRYLIKSQNLADVPNKATARGNLGLGNSATLNTGTVSGTVAAGNDSRIVNAVQTSRTITAGNGLVGGGNLGGNITLALGTPLHVSGTSGNTVTATGHTHAVDVASLYTAINPTAWTHPTRSKGVTYSAPTNKWIMVSVTCDTDQYGWSTLQGIVNNVLISSQRTSYDHPATNSISFIVPAGASYRVDCDRNITLWAELR